MVPLVDEPHWRELLLEDGEPAVRILRLFVNRSTGSSTALVRFPKGWERTPAGHYDVDEEVLFIEGSFEMGSETFNARSYAYFPMGFYREHSASPTGALALAIFGGPVVWQRGTRAWDDVGVIRIADWQELEPGTVPLRGGGSGRLLRRHAFAESWILERSSDGNTVVDCALELVSLSDYQWERVMPGSIVPEVKPPLFCRFGGVDI